MKPSKMRAMIFVCFFWIGNEILRRMDLSKLKMDIWWKIVIFIFLVKNLLFVCNLMPWMIPGWRSWHPGKISKFPQMQVWKTWNFEIIKSRFFVKCQFSTSISPFDAEFHSLFRKNQKKIIALILEGFMNDFIFHIFLQFSRIFPL